MEYLFESVVQRMKMDGRQLDQAATELMNRRVAEGWLVQSVTQFSSMSNSPTIGILFWRDAPSNEEAPDGSGS